MMDFLHEHNVKGYVAFNVLIFTDELPAAEEQLLLMSRAGVDAAIVQDLGLVSLARELVPTFHIHASTQMTLTSPEGIAFANRLGISLGRCWPGNCPCVNWPSSRTSPKGCRWKSSSMVPFASPIPANVLLAKCSVSVARIGVNAPKPVVFPTS